VSSGQNSIAVLTGTGMLNVQQIFNQNSPDGGTYLKFDAAQRTKPAKSSHKCSHPLRRTRQHAPGL